MKRKSKLLEDKFYTFDIETTTYIKGLRHDGNADRVGIVYHGQFYDGETYAYVRDLQGVIDMLYKINAEAENKAGMKRCIFVHFLSYEFQFIKDFFEWDKLLAVNKRKIITATSGNLEFRCSYMLSNMNLRMYLQKMNVPEEFQKTELDYNVQRFPWTELTEDEQIYNRNDVVGLHIAISKEIENLKQRSINNLPVTSTGFVRTDMRAAMSLNPSNKWRFKKERLSFEQFQAMHSAFRGGNTHANRYHANKIIRDVFSIDINSSYPFQLMTKKFPGKFIRTRLKGKSDLDYWLDKSDKYALLIKVYFEDVHIKEGVYIPYMTISKFEDFKAVSETVEKMINDNGRVLYLPSGVAWLTEIDMNIIKKQYSFKYKILDCFLSYKKPLPDEMKSTIMKYYSDKCMLSKDDPLRMKSKNKLNGIYGMCVTSPVKIGWVVDECHNVVEDGTSEEELFNAFNNSWGSFLSYQWGVWTAAEARKDLQEMLDVIGSDVVYCDTDSVKGLNYEKHIKEIEEINTRKKKEAIENNAYVGENYLGVFAFEEISEKFKTWGAKKYMHGSDDNYEITISGIPKRIGHQRIEEARERGEIDSPFDIEKGFCFESVKSAMEYNDDSTHFEEIEGHKVLVSSNIAAYSVNYLLGLTYDYEMLLSMVGDEYEDR